MHHILFKRIAVAGAITTIPFHILDPGGITHFLALFAVIASGVILIAALLILMLFRRGAAPACRGWMLAIASVMAIHAASLGIGLATGAWQVGRAKNYCDHLIPRLDSIRAATGRYPTAIDPILDKGRHLPLLLERACDASVREHASFYRVTPAGYCFEFPGPSYLLPDDVWRWESARREWYFDD
jgi:hypothetical protein